MFWDLRLCRLEKVTQISEGNSVCCVVYEERVNDVLCVGGSNVPRNVGSRKSSRLPYRVGLNLRRRISCQTGLDAKAFCRFSDVPPSHS